MATRNQYVAQNRQIVSKMHFLSGSIKSSLKVFTAILALCMFNRWHSYLCENLTLSTMFLRHLSMSNTATTSETNKSLYRHTLYIEDREK